MEPLRRRVLGEMVGLSKGTVETYCIMKFYLYMLHHNSFNFPPNFHLVAEEIFFYSSSNKCLSLRHFLGGNCPDNFPLSQLHRGYSSNLATASILRSFFYETPIRHRYRFVYNIIPIRWKQNEAGNGSLGLSSALTDR